MTVAPKKNAKKDALENAEKEAAAKREAEQRLPVGSAVVEDDAGEDDDEEQEEAEDGEPVAPGPDAKPALLPDARSTTTAAQRPENELRDEWDGLAAKAVMAEHDARRWERMANDPLMVAFRGRLSQEVEELKESLIKCEGPKDLVATQAEVKARRWMLGRLSPVAFDDAARAARTHLATFEREVGPLFIDKFKRQASETLFAKTQAAVDRLDDAEDDLAIAQEQAKAAKLAELGAKGAETAKKAEALAGATS